MSENEVREPIQKRSIEKKEKIIKYGFDLICEKGYYNTNTAEIAKAAGVSTGIVYSYFKDKHDILLEGIKRYANNIFYPILDFSSNNELNKDNLEKIIKDMILKFIEKHKLSQTAHEEITAMTHSDKDVAHFFHENEIEMSNAITDLLIKNGFNPTNLNEKVHIAINLVDDLCHEIVYHKHSSMNYEIMVNLVVDCIVKLINS